MNVCLHAHTPVPESGKYVVCMQEFGARTRESVQEHADVGDTPPHRESSSEAEIIRNSLN